MKSMQQQMNVRSPVKSALQPRHWGLLKLLGWGVASATALAACANEPTAIVEAERKPLGKADADGGSCAASCGGQSDSVCWCDESCTMYGDCCSDYVQVCTNVDVDAPALCEATGGAWEDGACACEQDGASMGYVFDAATGCVPGEDYDPDAPALCEATGGAWEDGACECQQDGATTNLNYWFDPAKGCVPGEVDPVDDKTLCENTGGAWENDACECAQDGASLFFVFQAEIGCADPDDSPLRDAVLNAGAQVFFSASYAPLEGDGLYIIDRPGVADMVFYYKNFDEALDYLAQFDWAGTVEDAGACTGGLQTEVFPTVDCESDVGMKPEGCHYLSVQGFERMSYTMETLNEYGFAEFTEAEISKAMTAGEEVRRVFIDSRHGVTFAFAFKDGGWRLVLIDVSRYSCSA